MCTDIRETCKSSVFLSCSFNDDVFSSPSNDPDTPPPLPRKKRQSSVTSVYDNCTITTTRQSANEQTSGETTPVNRHSPRHLSATIPVINTPNSLSPTSPHSSISSTDDIDGPVAEANMTGAVQASTGIGNSLTASVSYQSHTAATATRLSHYDNMQQQTLQTTQQSFQHFTQQMKELTANSVSVAASGEETKTAAITTNDPNHSISLTLDLADSKPPPLPEKTHDSLSSPTSILSLSPRLRDSRRREQSQIVPSQYDNVLASMLNDPLVVPHRTIIPEGGVRTSHSAMFASSSSSSSSFSATQQQGSKLRVTFQQQQQQQQQMHCQRTIEGGGISARSAASFQQESQHMSQSVSAHAILSTTDSSTPPPLPEKKGKSRCRSDVCWYVRIVLFFKHLSQYKILLCYSSEGIVA